MPKPLEIELPRQLLVEGNDARNFCDALLDHLSIDDIQVQNFGGVDELPRFLRGFVLLPSFRDRVTSLAVVRDAEQSASSAYQSVQDSLVRVGFVFGAASSGTNNGMPDVSIFILPDAASAGMLETLIWRSVQGQQTTQCVDDYVSCLERVVDVPLARTDKALVNAYLSSTGDPQVSVGVAAKKNIWDLDHEAFDELRSFLSSF